MTSPETEPQFHRFIRLNRPGQQAAAMATAKPIPPRPTNQAAAVQFHRFVRFGRSASLKAGDVVKGMANRSTAN